MLLSLLLAATAFTGITTSAPTSLKPRIIPGVTWTVKSFTRTCGTPYNIPICTYQFLISSSPSKPDFACHISDTGIPAPPLPASPVYNSFYSISCNAHTGVDGGWVISWGYNSVYDFAVMTVLNRDLRQDAWFGWNDVSKNSKFPDVGPNPVYALGTFT